MHVQHYIVRYLSNDKMMNVVPTFSNIFCFKQQVSNLYIVVEQMFLFNYMQVIKVEVREKHETIHHLISFSNNFSVC